MWSTSDNIFDVCAVRVAVTIQSSVSYCIQNFFDWCLPSVRTASKWVSGYLFRIETTKKKSKCESFPLGFSYRLGLNITKSQFFCFPPQVLKIHFTYLHRYIKYIMYFQKIEYASILCYREDLSRFLLNRYLSFTYTSYVLKQIRENHEVRKRFHYLVLLVFNKLDPIRRNIYLTENISTF